MDMDSSIAQWIISRIRGDERVNDAEAKAVIYVLQSRSGPEILKLSTARDALFDALKRSLLKDDNDVDDTDVSALVSFVIAYRDQFPTIDQFERGNIYKTARLHKELLLNNNLSDYVQAAEDSYENAKPFLDYLLELQMHDTEVGLEPDDDKVSEPNQYVCITASSGTGKTQLAATASLKYEAATTIYLNFSLEGASQRFYKPHTSNQSGELVVKLIEKFAGEVRGSLIPEEDEDKEQGRVTAHMIGHWAKHHDNGTSLFVCILHGLLLSDEDPNVSSRLCQGNKFHLQALKAVIQAKKTKFLVFLDEMPHKTSAYFSNVLCLRETLRYLGIAPILMSTHTGSEDYASESSRDSLDVWTDVLSRLPPYAPFPTGSLIRPYIVESERPLVLANVLELINNDEGVSLGRIVDGVRSTLQETKGVAWKSNPSLQLVQLFCTDFEIEQETFSSAHNLVGYHFGCLQHQVKFDPENLGVKYKCSEARLFGKTVAVAPVSATYEPLLYLALVTWDESMLPGAKNRHFPLVDNKGHALTVREVFETYKHEFKPRANAANVHSIKKDGDLLEVLVHASFTLASMKMSNDDGLSLPGVALKEFAPLVRRLMMRGKLNALPQTPLLFESMIKGFDWPRMPALGGSNSGLPSDKLGEDACTGFLKRPLEKEMGDGFIIEGNEAPLFSIECKNYKDGVDETILKEVFVRIPSRVKCSFVFVSSMKRGTFEMTKLADLKKSFINHKNNGISVVRWEENKDPYILKVKGGAEFKATQTELLVLIIEVGAIVAGELDRSEKRNSPPCSNFPMRTKRHKGGSNIY